MLEQQDTADLVFTIKSLNSRESAQYISAIFEAIRDLEETEKTTKNITYNYNSTPKTPTYRGPG